MHVLTKLFIVLVSLLAVFLVPLVVVYSHNENSFKSRFLSAEAQAATASANLQAAKLAATRIESAKNNEIQQLQTERQNLLKTLDERAAAGRKLEVDLAESRAGQDEIRAKLGILTAAVDSNQKLVSSLINETKTLRSDAIIAQQQATDAEEAMREVQAQLDVAIAARKALQEELARVKDERAQALDTIAKFVAKYGALPDTVAAGQLGLNEIAPDRNLDAKVTQVNRSSARTRVQLDIGSRDGVKRGWVLMIARSGEYLGKVVVEEVDIATSVGYVVEGVSPKAKEIKVNDDAIARVGNR